jgi:hypothetical protein
VAFNRVVCFFGSPRAVCDLLLATTLCIWRTWFPDLRMVWWTAGMDPALGHPIEYISLDGSKPAVCKYCGLRYYQGDAHGHH